MKAPCRRERPEARFGTVERFPAWLLVFAEAIPGPAVAQAVTERVGPACEASASLGDVREISCRLVPRGERQRFRFKAHFSGGHDDTKASLSASIDGEAVDCESGSKTRLFGEEGDVSLECIFQVAGRENQPRVLKVAILWSHAQYRNFELIDAE